MVTDTELLRQYACEHGEGAFAELVGRHVNLVYSAAMREAGGDAALAEDLSQAVFAELARKASQLLRHPSLAGWLYTCVRHVAANQRRADARRRQREQSASSMNETPSSETPEAVWSQIRPLLDDAMHELGETDRAAVVQRFFEDQSLRDVGISLGLSENAARMRVDRALEKLRALLARRGIDSTASGLAAALAVGAVVPAPAALAASIATTTLAGAAVVTTNSLTWVQVIAMTKLKIVVVSALIVAGVATPVWQQFRVNQLAREQVRLAEQTAQIEPLQNEVERLRQTGTGSAELVETRSEASRLRSELARLRGNAGEVLRKKEENARLRTALAKKASEDGTNEVTGAMSDLMNDAASQFIQGRLSRMKEKLNLTPDQAKAIEELLLAQITRATSMTRQLMAGKKIAAEDRAKADSPSENTEQRIKDLLTPEQLEAYKDVQKEENVDNARIIANSEVMRLQMSLSLAPEQEAKVRDALYEHSLNQLNGGLLKWITASRAANPGSRIPASQILLDQKLKALEPVLTPEQLDKYRQLQETQQQQLKSLSTQTPKP